MSTSSSKAPSKASPAPDKGDDQVQTDAAGAVYEALVQQPNGHRTVVRSKASSPAAAEREVRDVITSADVPPSKLLAVAPGDAGLGSGA